MDVNFTYIKMYNICYSEYFLRAQKIIFEGKNNM
jgi:hypothetical protein